jgi:hypothetical protein
MTRAAGNRSWGFGMTQRWRGGLDTSSLAVRLIACALLFLAIGAVGPKRKPAPPGFVPRVTLETVAKDASRPAGAQCVGSRANAPSMDE